MIPARRVPTTAGRRLGVGFAAAVCFLAAGCDSPVDATPREAWERSIAIRLERDHAAFWDSLASVSKQDFHRVLMHVKHDPRYLRSMGAKLAASREELLAMDARGFFLALMNAAERDIPGVVDRQLQQARGAEFVSIEVDHDRAVVYWRSGDGTPARTLLLREDDVWKTVLRR